MGYIHERLFDEEKRLINDHPDKLGKVTDMYNYIQGAPQIISEIRADFARLESFNTRYF